MRTIYIDSDYKCHTERDSAIATVETDFFDDKCDAYIEGYRFVPAGHTWIREDGTVFKGEMITPWKDFWELDAMQRDYERQQLADAQTALAVIYEGVMA